MILYWDKQNQPIENVLTWARLFEDHEYRRIAFDEHDGVVVSTIWQGLDLSHTLYQDGSTAMIFETLVWRPPTGEDLARTYWHTEADALEGHQALVRLHLPHRLLPGAERLLGAPDIDIPRHDGPGSLPA